MNKVTIRKMALAIGLTFVAIGVWAQDAMQWGVAVKLISGVATPNGAILQPQGSATRAQIAKVILNFFENVYTE